MKIKVQYMNSDDRQLKINVNLDKHLVEEQNITEGNFLIFTNIKPLETQLLELEETQMTILSGIADIYMSQLGF